ncbi:MAG: hypothetical protein R6W90_11890, partial [Ignavibacteriaceae bacterium]
PLKVFIKAGANYSTAIVTDEINLRSSEMIDEEWSEKSWGPFVEITFGPEIQIGSISIIPNIGYQYSLNIIPSEWGKFFPEGGTKNIGHSGVIAQITLETDI